MEAISSTLYTTYSVVKGKNASDTSAMHSTKINPEPRALPLESSPFTAKARPWSWGSLSRKMESVRAVRANASKNAMASTPRCPMTEASIEIIR